MPAGMRQGTLFPTGYEVKADALEALARLNVEGASEHVRRAREREPGDRDLVVLQQAVAWLARRVRAGEAARELAAAAFEAVPEAAERGAARVVDEAVAGFVLRGGRGGAFVDVGRRVPVGAMWLVAGQPQRAWRELWAALEGGGMGRADVWGYLAVLVARAEKRRMRRARMPGRWR